MAKENKKISFSNGFIEKDDNGNFIITETVKDGTQVYNLSDVLESFSGIEGVKLDIQKTSEIPSEE